MATRNSMRQLGLWLGGFAAVAMVIALLTLGSGLARASGCAANAAATATPVAIDPAAMPTAQFAKDCFEVASGQPLQFNVTLSKTVSKLVFVDVAVDDGTPDGVYMGSYGIPANQLSASFTAPSFVKLGDSIKILRVVSDGANGAPAELGSPIVAKLMEAAPPPTTPPDPCGGAYPPPTCGNNGRIYLPMVQAQ